MEIKSRILKDFLSKAHSGLIKTGYIDFEKRGIHFMGQCKGVVLYEGLIKHEVLEDSATYKPIGKYVLRDVGLAEKMVGAFSKTLKITVSEDNLIVFMNTSKKISMRLGSEDIMEDIIQPKFEYDKMIRIKTNELQTIIKDISILGEKSLVKFCLAGKELKIEMSNREDSIVNTIRFDEDMGYGTSELDSVFLNKILSSLTSEYVFLGIKDNYPLQIKENFGNHTLSKWIIAPNVEEDENENSSIGMNELE